MKKRMSFLAALVLLGFVVVSCSQSTSKSGKTSQENQETTIEIGSVKIDPAASKVLWAGTSVGVYTHTGTVDLTSADIKTSEGKITGGSFTADLTTMVATDENFNVEKGATKEKLIGHLKSPDFFDVDNFPTASFEITGVDGNTATGKLTVRGITNEEKVENIAISKEGDTVKISGDLKFERKKYEVKWDYPMKDNLLQNEIELKIELIGS